MRIICDFDSVIVGLVGPWQRWHEKHCPLRMCALGNILLEMPCCDIRRSPRYDLENWAPCGNALYGFFDENPYLTVDFEPGARWGLHRLEEKGHQVILASNIPKQHPEHYGYKQDWITEHLGMDWTHRFVACCGNKNAVTGDVLIDDNPAILKSWPGDHTVLFDQPWNKGADAYHRAAGWNGVIARVEQIEHIERQALLREERVEVWRPRPIGFGS